MSLLFFCISGTVMRIISKFLIIFLLLIYSSVYSQSTFEQYIKLFPEFTLPYNLNKEKINALKKEVKPIPKRVHVVY